MIKKLAVLSVFVVSFLLFSSGAAAQTKIPVRFNKGESGKTITGTVAGYGYKDYIVGASAGQTINVKIIRASSPSTIFTVFLPNGDNLDGAAEMDDFSGELPATGKYVIRVGMMRSQARRKGSVSNYTLKLSIN